MIQYAPAESNQEKTHVQATNDSATHFNTRAVHAGMEPDPATGAVMTPIYQTSTYAQTGINEHRGYDYARSDNPTRTALQLSLIHI